ncbi:hypothetical protein F511_19446 [Dorcoceras hygrometricum]|uniref:Uncharacterized protein n=1 Tax=Dorcoceras hygrometricum TaxID=472368 RepID=A0A2Z7BJK0_9LAMI|nr:hypothetical protein F511_19446 [Dorcoceras hygrometricum]
MSSPNSSIVREVAESIDLSSISETSRREEGTSSLADPHRARILRIDQDEARLAAQGCTWYEIKASTLRESDIPLIRDKGWISKLFEVVVPRVEARAHRPPVGFHTFYVNQIERVSVQIKRLGPGKFYISNQCVGGNPSSHKGWMSRYFFIKRISSRENPWNCDMSWRDNARTQPPPIPEHSPDLSQLLEVTREKCFDAQSLIEEDLLCHFNFSPKRVRLVGDLDDRMSKAEMLKALKARKNEPEGASHSLDKGKRKAEAEGGERRKKRYHEKTPEPTRETILEIPISEPKGAKDFTRRLIPDQDYDVVKSVPDLAALDASSLHFMQPFLKRVLTGVAQFRESGYTEEEHLAPFLDVERALAALSDDEDAEESNLSQEEAPPA